MSYEAANVQSPSIKTSSNSSIHIPTKKYAYKEEIRVSDSRSTIRVSNFNPAISFVQLLSCTQDACGILIENDQFQKIMIFMVVFNAFTLGIATSEFVTKNEKVLEFFDNLDQVFLILFTVEVLIYLIHYGPITYFSRKWLRFDFIITSLSWVFESFSIFRAFRVLKLLRLIPRIAELRDLVKVLVSVVPKIASILTVLSLVFYVFGVLFTKMFGYMHKNDLTQDDYFSSLPKTLFTLFQIMTLDGWIQITREIMETYKWASIPITIFILISSFVVVNMTIAVMCTAVGDLHRQKALEEVQQVKRQLTFNQEDFHSMQNQVTRLTKEINVLLAMNRNMQRTLNDQSRIKAL